MVLHNPNNWHWVNKDVSEWARQYLDKNLTAISAKKDDVSAKITNVASMDGDVDVSQRKGKVITLFDVKLQLDFEGEVKDEKDITGTIAIPEVAHDTEEAEYVFDIDIHSFTPSKQPLKDLIRTSILPQLRHSLHSLAPALIAEHGKDIQHAPNSNPSSGVSTPINKTTSSSATQSLAKPSSASSHTSTANGPAVNTTTLSSTAEFRTTASELYTTFTDPSRLAAFTRSPPNPFEGAHPGGKFGLFGGGVEGQYVSLKEPTQIVQRWRLATWPKGHFATLTLDFDQDDVDSVTVMRTSWVGVPVGQEEGTKGRWGEYYERALKTTFGFGTIL